jgi:uncharacterized membrane protein YkvA (DUF1232 family)
VARESGGVCPREQADFAFGVGLRYAFFMHGNEAERSGNSGFFCRVLAVDYGKIRVCVRLLPKFLGLLLGLLRDPRVSTRDKAILGAVVAYVLNPVDLVPDLVPFLGLVDDVYLVALALLRLFLRTGDEVLLEHWQGPEDLLPLVRRVTKLVVLFLPPPIRRSLLAEVDD